MTTPPALTVIMPVFNSAPYLLEAVESILQQTYTDFELLIIDDGSTDNSLEILQGFDDTRIRLVRNRVNSGLISTLNKGLSLATGQNYIARMDADDICLSDRLEQQVCFLDSNPSVGVCGTWLETFGSTAPQLWSPPADDADIRSSLLFESVIYHPTVMFRRSLLDDVGVRYAIDYPHAEDYELWTRLLHTCRFANLEQVLLKYRLHDDNVGIREAPTQQISADRVRLRCLRELGIEPSDDELALHSAISRWRVPPDIKSLQQVHDWLVRLIAANCDSGLFPADVFDRGVAQRWFMTCFISTAAGSAVYRLFSRSSLGKVVPLTLRQRLVFLGRTLVCATR